MKHGNLLTWLILAGLVAGALVGQLVLHGHMGDPGAHWTRRVAELVLLRPLQLLVIPLAFVSVVSAVTAIGSPSRLGVIGSSIVLYYLATMLVSVAIGVLLASAVRPGDLPEPVRSELRGSSEAALARDAVVASDVAGARADGRAELSGAWVNLLRQLVPRNLFDEMTRGRLPGVFAFALLLGLALAACGERARAVVEFFEGLLAAMMTLVRWVIWLVPAGVFLLTAWSVGFVGAGALWGPVGWYVLLVLAGLAIHGLLVLPAALLFFVRRNPYRFLWQMRRALLAAFGTGSSLATLPVTLESAVGEGGCSKRAAGIVLPLGASLNMDGTALSAAVAVVFLFQLWGSELGFGELVIVVTTATLAAAGSAGIPSAGAVTMVIVIGAVNKVLEGRDPAAIMLPVAAIGVIVGVERIVHMCRTAVDVWGDAVGARIITVLAPEE